jgi:hypothetical protein
LGNHGFVAQRGIDGRETPADLFSAVFYWRSRRNLFSVAKGKYRATAAATSRLLAVVLFCGAEKLRRRLVEGESEARVEWKFLPL